MAHPPSVAGTAKYGDPHKPYDDGGAKVWTKVDSKIVGPNLHCGIKRITTARRQVSKLTYPDGKELIAEGTYLSGEHMAGSPRVLYQSLQGRQSHWGPKIRYI